METVKQKSTLFISHKPSFKIVLKKRKVKVLALSAQFVYCIQYGAFSVLFSKTLVIHKEGHRDTVLHYSIHTSD